MKVKAHSGVNCETNKYGSYENCLEIGMAVDAAGLVHLNTHD